MKREEGYITILLTLVLGVMLGVVMISIEGIRENLFRLETEASYEMAADSVLAQYHSGLFEEYGILAVDTGYLGNGDGLSDLEMQFSDYLDANMSGRNLYGVRNLLQMSPERVEVTRAQCLTDEDGEVYAREAVAAFRSETGMETLNGLMDLATQVKEQEVCYEGLAQRRDRTLMEIRNQYARTHSLLETEVDVDKLNPTREVDRQKKVGIMGLLMPDLNRLSAKGLMEESLVEQRKRFGLLNQGNLYREDKQDGLLQDLLFKEYLYEHFGCYTKEKGRALDYELEYLIAGKGSDIENFNSILLRLLGVRTALNTGYILTDVERCAQAEAAALATASVLLIPQATEGFKYLILLGWAFAESVLDVRTLAYGGNVPFMKTPDSWQTSMTDMLAGLLGSFDEVADHTEGMTYPEYLRLLLLLKDTKTLSMRAMNLTEANIRLTENNAGFRLDRCYSAFSILVYAKSGYGYTADIERTKGYTF